MFRNDLRTLRKLPPRSGRRTTSFRTSEPLVSYWTSREEIATSRRWVKDDVAVPRRWGSNTSWKRDRQGPVRSGPAGLLFSVPPSSPIDGAFFSSLRWLLFLGHEWPLFLNFKIYFCFPFFSLWTTSFCFTNVRAPFWRLLYFLGFSKNCSAISSFVTQYRSQTAAPTPNFNSNPRGFKNWIDLSWKCLRLHFTLSAGC